MILDSLHSRVCQSQCKHILKVKELYLVLQQKSLILSTLSYNYQDKKMNRKVWTINNGIESIEKKVLSIWIPFIFSFIRNLKIVIVKEKRLWK